jgi:hypothetical protein
MYVSAILKSIEGSIPVSIIICGGNSERLSTGQKVDMQKHSGWHQQADGGG